MHTTGGYMVQAHTSTRYVFDLQVPPYLHAAFNPSIKLERLTLSLSVQPPCAQGLPFRPMSGISSADRNCMFLACQLDCFCSLLMQDAAAGGLCRDGST